MRRWSPPLFLATLLLSAGTVPAATAAEADQAWQRDGRDLVLEERSDRVILRSARESALGTDHVTIEFHRSEARIAHRFAAQDENATGAVLSLRLAALLEYRSDTADGRIEPGAEIIERYPMDVLPSQPFAIDELPNGYRVTAEYAIPDRRAGGLADGTLALSLTMRETRGTIDGTTLDPTEALVDARVDRHPFRETDSRFAFEYELATDQVLSAAAAGEDALHVPAGPYQTYLEWADTARVGLQEPAVGVTLMSHLDETGANAATLWVTMPQGLSMGHGHVLGTMRFAAPDAVRDLVARGDAVIYAAALALTLLAVGLPVARRLREA